MGLRSIRTHRSRCWRHPVPERSAGRSRSLERAWCAVRGVYEAVGLHVNATDSSAHALGDSVVVHGMLARFRRVKSSIAVRRRPGGTRIPLTLCYS